MANRVLKVTNAEQDTVTLTEEVIDYKEALGGAMTGAMTMSADKDCKRFLFVELPVGYQSELDFAPRRQIAIVQSGQVLFRLNGTETVTLEAGDVIRLEDTDFENPGRHAEVVGDRPARLLVVQHRCRKHI